MNWLIKSLFAFSVLCLIGSSAKAQKTDRYDLDETYDMSATGKIKLQSDDAHVEIIGTDREDLHLVVQYRVEVKGFTIGKQNRFSVEVTERAGDIEIREKPRDFGNRGINIGYVDEEYSIIIEAPQGASLEIEGDDDAYEISGINGSIRMETDDSDILVRRCEGDLFRFDFDDGEFLMIGGRGELRMSYDDGEADIRNANFEWMNIDTDDGSIILSATLAENSDYTFTTDDGRVNLTVLGGGGNFRIDHDEVRVYASSAFEEIRDDDTYNEYRLPGGNAKVRIETDEGDIRLDTQ